MIQVQTVDQILESYGRHCYYADLGATAESLNYLNHAEAKTALLDLFESWLPDKAGSIPDGLKGHQELTKRSQGRRRKHMKKLKVSIDLPKYPKIDGLKKGFMINKKKPNSKHRNGAVGKMSEDFIVGSKNDPFPKQAPSPQTSQMFGKPKTWDDVLDIADEQFPKGRCVERGKMLVVLAYAKIFCDALRNDTIEKVG